MLDEREFVTVDWKKVREDSEARKLAASKMPGTGKIAPSIAFAHVFFFGDLNYRIGGVDRHDSSDLNKARDAIEHARPVHACTWRLLMCMACAWHVQVRPAVGAGPRRARGARVVGR